MLQQNRPPNYTKKKVFIVKTLRKNMKTEKIVAASEKIL